MDIERIPLIGGHPALDFVNSVEERETEAEVNYLSDYGRLTAWCARAGLIPASVSQDLARQAALHPVVAARAWAEGMDLRAALNLVFRAVAESKDPPKRAMASLNAMLEQALANRRLQVHGRREIGWAWNATSWGLDTLAWEIVLSAANLLADPDRQRRIKICANGHCDWMFLDESRTGRRRWCRMNVCGNAAKVQRFRERHRADQA